MIKGALVFLSGLRLLFARSELRELLWRMLGLLLLMMVILSVGAFWMVDYLVALWLPEGDAWYLQFFSWLFALLALLVSLLTAAIGFVAFGSAAVAPWLDELAVRTEQAFGTVVSDKQGTWAGMVVQSLVHTLRPLLELIGWGVVALLLSLIPPLAAAIWGYAGVRFLMYELIDTPASRRDWGFAERKGRLNRQRWFYFGFAGTAALLLLLPLINLLVIPAAVVGLTRHLVSGESQS